MQWGKLLKMFCCVGWTFFSARTLFNVRTPSVATLLRYLYVPEPRVRALVYAQESIHPYVFFIVFGYLFYFTHWVTTEQSNLNTTSTSTSSLPLPQALRLSQTLPLSYTTKWNSKMSQSKKIRHLLRSCPVVRVTRTDRLTRLISYIYYNLLYHIYRTQYYSILLVLYFHHCNYFQAN